MKQCEIWDVNFDPKIGSEQSGYRPALIISGNTMNDNFPLVIVCPLTSKIKNFLGNVVINPSSDNGLTQKSEILIFQIKSISKKRLVKKRGTLPLTIVEEIKILLNEILTL